MQEAKTDRRLSISDLEQWVNNDEGLYNWWKSEGGSLRSFVQANREEIERGVRRVLDAKPRERDWRDVE